MTASGEVPPWASVRPNAETVPDTRVRAGPNLAHSRPLPTISIDFSRASLKPARSSGEPSAIDVGPPSSTDLEVTGTLGEGGMGVVLLARQHLLSRDVAIKTVKDGDNQVAHAALLAEGQISGSLEHPGIIPVHALGLDNSGRPVLVMKRVVGVSWFELLDDPGHPGWRHWTSHEDRLVANIEILMQVCNAVHFAHSHGVVHRDIKPHNVLIGRYGDVYLADWGLAARMDQLSAADSFIGTPAYAAPEMVAGKGVGVHSDIYLLGATLHHVLVGKPRHDAATMGEALAGALSSAAYDYPDDVPPELAALANRATAQTPAERPAAADAFRRALSDYLQHRSSSALAESAIERLMALRPLLAREDDADRALARQIDELSAEARFGLKQALAQWPDNLGAQAAQIELQALLHKRNARRHALGRLARDLDPKRAARQRFILFMVFAAIVVGQSTMGVMQWSSGTPWSAKELTFHMLGGLALIVGLVIALRGPLRRSAVNRNGALLAVTSFAALAVGRAFGWYSGEPPAHILATDLLLLGAIAALASVMMSRWFVLLIALMPVSALLCRLWPPHAVLTFSFATAVGSIVVMLAMRGPAIDPAFERPRKPNEEL